MGMNSNFKPKIAILEDRKADGVNGGSMSAGWQTRDLNTISSDDSNIISLLSSNAFTPIAGTYNVDLDVTYRASGRTQVCLYKNGIRDVEGVNNFSTTSSGDGANAKLSGIIQANGTDVFRIDQFSENSKSTNGRGSSLDNGNDNIYARLVLEKIG